MSPGGTEMIIDKVMPDFDAVRAEHRVIVGTPAELFAIALEAERIDASDFADFSRPGLARIAANLSFRPYGAERTLVSYERRVQATDTASRRAFMRYWQPVSPPIGVALRSVLKLIEEEK